MNGDEVRIYDGRPTAFATVVSIATHELNPANRQQQLDLLVNVVKSDEDETDHDRSTKDHPPNTSTSRR